MKHVALLRGIGPGDPRMRNEKLRTVFESLGLTDVRSVIASGNIVFSANSAKGLEKKIEDALYEQLGFHSTTIIRSQKEIEQLMAMQPFDDAEHSRQTYLMVTFLKEKPSELPFSLPCVTNDGASTILAYDSKTRTLFAITDATAVKTPDLMAFLEKQLGKGMTSRTWKTVERIYKKLL